MVSIGCALSHFTANPPPFLSSPPADLGWWKRLALHGQVLPGVGLGQFLIRVEIPARDAVRPSEPVDTRAV